MKKILIVFGVLDILTLLRALTITVGVGGIWSETQVYILTAFKWALYLSLIFSAFFLIRQKKAGIGLSYVQFPVRVFFIAYSFGFILYLSDNFGWGNFEQSIIGVVFGLEVLRLIVTIVIHRKYYLR